MKTNRNLIIDEIWSLHQKYSRAPGMGNYGRGWEIQREYYQKLPQHGKRMYEDAILTLCQSEEIQKVNFAITASSQLVDIFPNNWANRIIPIVEILVKTVQPRYKDTATYNILSLIWEFRIQPLIPFVREFKKKITSDFKQGILARGEWELLYSQVSRILIRVSTEEFWKEFIAFQQDRELLDLLGPETKAVISIWVSFGAVTYGLDWLSKMVNECSNYSDEQLKSQTLLSIKQSFSIVVSRDPTIRITEKEFSDWAASQLTKH